MVDDELCGFFSHASVFIVKKCQRISSIFSYLVRALCPRSEFGECIGIIRSDESLREIRELPDPEEV